MQHMALRVFVLSANPHALQAMHEAGFRLTLVGHSLGAGAAVLLSVMFREAGIERLRCYAFAPPNCVDARLSAGCAGHVTSVVFRDDIVARFSPEALRGLMEQLLDFDLDEALEKVRDCICSPDNCIAGLARPAAATSPDSCHAEWWSHGSSNKTCNAQIY